MFHARTTREKVVLFLKIFFPILIYQLATYSASFIDTMMTGQYSTQHLAGVSMATSLWNPFFSLATAIVSALVPIIGHHLGRGEKEQVRKELHQFIYLTVLLVLILFLIVICVAIPALSWLHLEPEVLAVGQGYLSYILIGILPLILFSVFRSFFDALGLTKLSMYLMLLLVPFNSFFNYILIYGKLGMPEMGGVGAGLGTSLAYWAVLIVVLVVSIFHNAIRPYEIWKWTGFERKRFVEGFRLGFPIGLQTFAEVAIFAVVGLLMAKFSSQVIAAHQAAMNFATLMYAFPVSISMALPIVISYEMGAKRFIAVKEYTKIGRLIAFAFSALSVSFIFVSRGRVAFLYGDDPIFIKLTSEFLVYALFFQLADAFTAPLQGILRGYKDTTMPFVIGVSTYWSVAIPLALLLEYTIDLGPVAYWVGLIMGIFACGILLQRRLRKLEKRMLSL